MAKSTVRLDKWLQVARAFKTRSKATNACNLSRVKVNGVTAKPHRQLALEDRVEVEIGDWTRVLVVKELRDKTLPKAEAARGLRRPEPAASTARSLRASHAAAAGRPARRGAGRPSKKERRELDKLRKGLL